MANLLESYKGRIALSEKYYSQMNAGLKMSNQKKINQQTIGKVMIMSES